MIIASILPYTALWVSLYPYQNFDFNTLMIYSFGRYSLPTLIPFSLLYLGVFDVPVLLRVILDSTVGAEFAHLFVLLNTPYTSENTQSIGLSHTLAVVLMLFLIHSVRSV